MAYTTFTYNSTDYDLDECPTYPLKESYIDLSIHNKTDDGYLTGRSKYTKNRKTFTSNYLRITTSDKEKIESLEALVQYHTPFIWYNLADSSAPHTVFFVSPVNYSYVSFNRWDVSFTVVEQ